MASIMGQRMQRAGLEQQTHRDLVNEMYQKQIGAKVEAETERMRPTIPYKGTMVNQADYLKLKTLENSSTTALMKEYDLHRTQAKAAGEEPMGWDEYQMQNNTWVEQYSFYALQEEKAGRKVKSFDKWRNDTAQSGAMRLTTPQVIERRVGVERALTGEQILSSDGMKMVQKRVDDYFKSTEGRLKALDYKNDPEGLAKFVEVKKYGFWLEMVEGEFGPENVHTGKKNGRRGAQIRMKDGKVTWRSAP